MPIVRPPYGNELLKTGAISALLKVTAQDTPNMTVRIGPGGYWKEEVEFVQTAKVNSAAIVAPIADARYDMVCLKDTGLPTIVSGITGVNPALPTVPPNYLPLAAIFVQAGQLAITDTCIYDMRPFFKAGSRPSNHNLLISRNVPDAHEITAITGLQALLDGKVSLLDVNGLLDTKADVTGTSSSSFALNKGASGIAGPEAYFSVERGAEPTVSIRWNEILELWQFTNDGTNWQSFNSPDLSPGIVTYATLDSGLQDFVDNHDHDARYYTQAEVDSLLGTKVDPIHIHSAADITTGTLAEARLPIGIDPAKLANGTVSTEEFQHVSGVTNPIQAQLDTKISKVNPDDIEITGSLNGIILQSVNGTRWRLTVNNTGAVVTTSI